MSKRFAAALILAVALLAASCAKTDDPSKTLAHGYTCTLNVADAAGEDRFAGTLVHAADGWTLTLSFPEDVAGTVVTVAGENAYGTVGDFTLTLSPSSVSRLRAVTDALGRMASGEKPSAVRAAALYGKKVKLLEFEDFTAYCDAGVPLVVTDKSAGVRAQITGFSVTEERN